MQIAALASMLFQDADLAAQPAPVAAHSSALGEMVHNSGPVAFTVLIVLAAASVFSISIIIAKWRSFSAAVMGIIDAFHGLGTAGGATLRAVAPGISEALITTAAGIIVAIPAVVGYNQLTAQLRDFGARMDDFGRELLNAIENAAAIPLTPPPVTQEETRRRTF